MAVAAQQQVVFMAMYTLENNELVAVDGSQYPVRKSRPFSMFTVMQFNNGPKAATMHKSPHEGLPRYDRAPQALSEIKAAYPYELLVAGTTGKATVRYFVGRNGDVVYAKVIKASHPLFGTAAWAKVVSTRFRPATRQMAGTEAPCPAEMYTDITFAPSSTDVAVDENTHRLIDELKSVSSNILSSPKQLDAAIKPVRQVEPFLYEKRENPQRVVFECIIDRNGMPQLARPIDATGLDPKQIHSILTALYQWRFEPPRKEGQPVDVRIRVPFML